MNEIMITEKSQLPVTIPDLQRFVLFGSEKIKVIHSEITLINSMNLATEVKKQKEQEMIEISKLIIEAEIKIKEYLTDNFRNRSRDGKREKNKLNIDKTTNDRITTLTLYKDEVEDVIKELLAENKIPLPVKVNSRIRKKKGKELQKTSRTIDKENIKYIEYAIECLKDYRKRYYDDLSKQHKIFKAIQVLEKFAYKG